MTRTVKHFGGRTIHRDGEPAGLEVYTPKELARRLAKGAGMVLTASALSFAAGVGLSEYIHHRGTQEDTPPTSAESMQARPPLKPIYYLPPTPVTQQITEPETDSPQDVVEMPRERDDFLDSRINPADPHAFVVSGRRVRVTPEEPDHIPPKTRDDIMAGFGRIYERASRAGGTWRDVTDSVKGSYGVHVNLKEALWFYDKHRK